MCGIAGFLTRDDAPVDRWLVKACATDWCTEGPTEGYFCAPSRGARPAAQASLIFPAELSR